MIEEVRGKLKCCPFCGSKTFDLIEKDNEFSVHCECGLSYGLFGEEDLIKKWNSRKQISDGYHTFQDLYNHRISLFAALCKHTNSYKSLKHDNDNSPMFDEMFIAGIDLPRAGQITYHLPIDMFEKFPAMELPRAKKWDGHSSDDVVKRLKEYSGY